VERAGEDDPAAAFEAAEHGAAVAARVDKGVQLAIAVTRDKYRLAAHISREVIVLVGDLALVREIDPVALEDVLHLEFEDLRVGEDVPCHLVGAGPGIVLDRRIDCTLKGV
jgi:hypothetical protein